MFSGGNRKAKREELQRITEELVAKEKFDRGGSFLAALFTNIEEKIWLAVGMGDNKVSERFLPQENLHVWCRGK